MPNLKFRVDIARGVAYDGEIEWRSGSDHDSSGEWEGEDMDIMKRTLGTACVLMALAATGWAEFKGGGKADEDYASFNVRNIGLIVIGKWKGSEAKVEPHVVATHIKEILRGKGYEVSDISDAKQLKAADENMDVILTVNYQSMGGPKLGIVYEGKAENKTGEYQDRMLKGTAEMVTTKRLSKKKKVLFKAAGTTASQMSNSEDGKYIYLGNAPREFATIVADVPDAAGAGKEEGEKAAGGEKKPEGEKKTGDDKKPEDEKKKDDKKPEAEKKND